MIIKYFRRQFLYYIGVAALPPKDKAGSSPTEWFIQLEKRDYLQAQLFSSNQNGLHAGLLLQYYDFKPSFSPVPFLLDNATQLGS